MNKSTGLALALVGAAVLFVAGCAGFDFGDVVHVQTPERIQAERGLPDSMSLNEAELEYEDWFTDQQTIGATWRNDIERADQISGMLGQLALSGLDAVGPTIAGVPVVGGALPLITFLAGSFFVRRPSDTTKAQAESDKNDAWDEATRVTRDLLQGQASSS